MRLLFQQAIFITALLYCFGTLSFAGPNSSIYRQSEDEYEKSREQEKQENFGIYSDVEYGNTRDDFISQQDMMDMLKANKEIDQYRENTFISYFGMRNRMRFYVQTMEDL